MKVGLQHAELDRQRTWSNDTTHAIHESQTLPIERGHEAHPRETSSSPVIFFAVLKEDRWPPGPAWLFPLSNG